MVPHCGFDLHFSDNEWCWASSHVFVSHLYVFFGEMLFSSLAHFLTGSFIFMKLSCRSCLYIFEISPLSVVSFAIIFSHSEGCLSPCLQLTLCAKKFNYIPLVYFCFYFHYSRRWIIADLSLVYIKECSAYVFL